MKHPKSWFAAALVITVFQTAPAAGQNSADPPGTVSGTGFWAFGGGAYALGRAGCDLCSDSHRGGLSLNGALGGALSPGIRLGVEGSAWRNTEEAFRQTMWSGTGVVYWHPNAGRSRWFVKGGLGIVGFIAEDLEDPDNDEEDITSRSFGGQVGAGYSIPVTSFLSLSPYFTFMGSFRAKLKLGDEEITGASLTLIQFGLGLDFH